LEIINPIARDYLRISNVLRELVKLKIKFIKQLRLETYGAITLIRLFH